MANPAVTINLRGDPAQLNRVLSGVQRDLRGLGSESAGAGNQMSKMGGVGAGSLMRLLGPIAMVTTAFLGMRAAISGISSSVSTAAEFEGYETSFITLLGSVDKAEKRMEDLANFGARTPFKLDEVVKANRQLEVFTKGALSTDEGMTLVGDAASGAGIRINELSMWVGRLYDGLKSGRPVGEAMMRLQELAVISGDTRTEIEELAEAGKSDEAWKAMEQGLKRFSGEMARQSMTWNGLMSNLDDSIELVRKSFGEPIMDSLKPVLSELVSNINDLMDDAERLGKVLAGGIDLVVQAVRDGKLGDLIGLSIMVGFQKARLAVNEFVNYILDKLTGGEGLGGIGAAFAAVAVAVGGLFLSAIEPVIQRLVAGAMMAGSVLAQSILDSMPAFLKNWLIGSRRSQFEEKIEQEDIKIEAVEGLLADLVTALKGKGLSDKQIYREGGYVDQYKNTLKEARAKRGSLYKELGETDVALSWDEAKKATEGHFDGLDNGMDKSMSILLDKMGLFSDSIKAGGMSAEEAQKKLESLKQELRNAMPNRIKQKDPTKGGEGKDSATVAKSGSSVADELTKVGGGGFVFGGIASQEDIRTRAIQEQTRATQDTRELQKETNKLLMENNRYQAQLLEANKSRPSETLTVQETN